MKKLFILTTCVLIACTSAFAADITWTQLVNNAAWDTAGNWNPSQVPAASDKAILNNGYGSDTYTIYLAYDGSATCGELDLPDASTCKFRINPWHPARGFTFDNGASNAKITTGGDQLTLGNIGSTPYTNYLSTDLDIDIGANLDMVAVFSGDKTVTFNSGQYLRLYSEWGGFTGKFIGNGGRIQMQTATSVPNGEFILQNGCRLCQANSLTLNQDLTLNGGWIFRYGSGNENQGDIKVIGVSPSRIYYYSNPYTFSGDVSGTYRLFVGHAGTTLNVLGSISPGTNSIGTLVLSDGNDSGINGTLNIGTGSDSVTANVEISGYHSDLLAVTNDVALDLANVDLEIFVTGSTSVDATNTVITCNNGLNNFSSMSIHWNGGRTGTVFQDGSDVKVTDIVPEPFAIGFLTLIGVLFLRKK